MIKLRQVFGLYGSGYGSRSISTTLGISRTTIRKYLCIFNESSRSLKEHPCKDDATLFDFFELAPTTYHSPRLDALSALLPDYTKRLKKRGVKKKHSTRSILNVIHKSIPIVVSIVSCAPIWPPANHFLKDLKLAGFPQLTFKRI